MSQKKISGVVRLTVLGGESCNFLTDSCKFPTEEIWMFKISISPLNFSRNKIFSASNIVFSKKIFPRDENSLTG